MPLLVEFALELLKLIASELEIVHDVLSFSLVCRQFNDAVNCDQSVFQALFSRLYEKPRNPEGYDYKAAFRSRHSSLLEDPEVLRDIVLDARPSPASLSVPPNSKNIKHLAQIFANRTPPPRYRALLYPLQFLSPAQSLHESLSDGTMLHDGMNTISILQDFPNQTDEIADLFAHYLHFSKFETSFFGNQLLLLQPSEFPSFWDGDTQSKGRVIPRRWFGAYLQLPLVFNEITQLPALTEMNMISSSQNTFSGVGYDIADFAVLNGKIHAAELDGRKRISWLKNYGSHQWRYEGMMEIGDQRILGAWGTPGLTSQFHWGGFHGIFMLWAVPEGTNALKSRVQLVA